MELYKVLNIDMRSPFKGFQFELGEEYVCGDFDDNPANECANGFYATDIDGLAYSFNINRAVWRCEVGGKSVEIDQFKRRYEQFKLIERVPHDVVKQLAKDREQEVGYKLAEVLFPIDPLLIKATLDDETKELLDSWDSVWGSVWDSVRASVWGSVWNSVWHSVRASVGNSVWASVVGSVRALVWGSVRASVWASVLAYVGSLFPNIARWEYTEHDIGEYPFQPAVVLWYAGFVPSFDGNVWRLHAGADAKVVHTQ
jgi:hypothetical protein